MGAAQTKARRKSRKPRKTRKVTRKKSKKRVTKKGRRKVKKPRAKKRVSRARKKTPRRKIKKEKPEKPKEVFSTKGKLKKVGSWENKSGTLIISDPGFARRDAFETRGFVISGHLPNARKGKWVGYVLMVEFSKRHIRIAELITVHSGEDPYKAQWQKSPVCVGVDSGQAGVFNADYYPTDSFGGKPSFYDKASKLTLSIKKAGVMKGGVVSSTGWGDGMYKSYVWRKAGKVVGVRIVFIEPDKL